MTGRASDPHTMGKIIKLLDHLIVELGTSPKRTAHFTLADKNNWVRLHARYLYVHMYT